MFIKTIKKRGGGCIIEERKNSQSMINLSYLKVSIYPSIFTYMYILNYPFIHLSIHLAIYVPYLFISNNLCIWNESYYLNY